MSILEIATLAKRVKDCTIQLGDELDKNDSPNNLKAKNICDSINLDIDRIKYLGGTLNEPLYLIDISLEGKTISVDEFLFNVKRLSYNFKSCGFDIFKSKYP